MESPTVVGASATGGVTLAWNLPAAIDTHHVFGCYMIYADNTCSNNWVLVDSVCGSTLYTQQTYSVPASALTTAFGPGNTTLDKSICFKIDVKNKLCPGDSISAGTGAGCQTNIIHSIFLTASQVGTGVGSYALTNWNPLFNCGPLPSSCSNYELWREYPAGSGMKRRPRECRAVPRLR